MKSHEPKLTRILTLDVGVTTGYAILEGLPLGWPNLIECGNIVLDDLEAVLPRIIADSKAERIFTELPVSRSGDGQLTRSLNEACRIVQLYAPGATNIPPGVWKGYKYITNQPIVWDGAPLTQHQKDAIQLGRVVFQNPARYGLA